MQRLMMTLLEISSSSLFERSLMIELDAERNRNLVSKLLGRKRICWTAWRSKNFEKGWPNTALEPFKLCLSTGVRVQSLCKPCSENELYPQLSHNLIPFPFLYQKSRADHPHWWLIIDGSSTIKLFFFESKLEKSLPKRLSNSFQLKDLLIETKPFGEPHLRLISF